MPRDYLLELALSLDASFTIFMRPQLNPDRIVKVIELGDNMLFLFLTENNYWLLDPLSLYILDEVLHYAFLVFEELAIQKLMGEVRVLDHWLGFEFLQAVGLLAIRQLSNQILHEL